jgi:transposase-like protein
VCREHNIASSVLVRWRHEYETRGEAAFTPHQPTELPETEALQARIDELERFRGQLALENSILRKAALLLANKSRNDTPGLRKPYRNTRSYRSSSFVKFWA